MKFASKKRFYLGVLIILILSVSYFIKFQSDIGDNYVDYDTLLGVLIFHNIFVLSAYLLIALLLIITGVKKVKFA